MAQRVEVQFVGSNASLLSAAKGAQGALDSVQSTVKTFQHMIAGIGVGFGVRELFGFGKESVKAFAEQEMAARTLQTVLMATGRGGKAAFDQITGSVEKVSEQTGVLDADLLRATGTLAEYAKKLSTGDLANSQKAIVALSTLTGKSLEESASMLGRSLTGTRNLLTRYIGDMPKGISQTEKLAIANTRLAASYEVAMEKVNTAQGAMQAMHNASIRVEEALGGIILKTFGFQGGMKNVAVALNSLAKYLRDNAGEWAAWGTLALAWIKDVVRESLDAGKALVGAAGLLGKHPIQAAKDIAAAWNDAIASSKVREKAQADYEAGKGHRAPLNMLGWDPNLKVPQVPGGDDFVKATKEKADKTVENLAAIVKAGAASRDQVEELRILEYLLMKQVDDTNLSVDKRKDAYNEATKALEALNVEDARGKGFAKQVKKLNLGTGATVGGTLNKYGGSFGLEVLKDQMQNEFSKDSPFALKMKENGAAIGESLIRGFIHGANNMRDLLTSMLEDLAVTAIMGPLKKSLGIASPSKKGMWIGQMFTEGVMLGMGGGRAAVPALAGVGGGGSGGGLSSHTYNTYHISAIDTRSFAEAVDRNHLVIGAAAAQAVDKNPGIRRAIRGG